MTPSTSACVVARDHARVIGRCLDSLAWADECVVLLDARSADATEAICRAAGVRVERRTYDGNVEQKNAALDLVKGEWVVALDADEALSPELGRRLRAFLAADGEGADGAELDRVTRHLGRWIRHGDFHPDWQLRVFRAGRGRWGGRNPHGRIRLEGRAVRLEGVLEHRSYADLADQLARIQEFSDVEARALHAEGRRARAVDLLLRPPARFLRAWIQKGGFRDGVPGLVVAAATAFHVFLKYAKLWELERAGGPRPASR